MSSKIQLSAQLPLERLVRACLAKDPDERFQSAHDVGLEVKWIGESPVAELAPGRPSGTSRLRLAAAIATFVALIATATVVVQLSRRPPPFALSIAPPQDCKFFGPAAISPDGSTIAFAAVDHSGDEWIWLRRLNDPEPKRMAKMARTGGHTVVFWSPDGKSIGYADGNLRLMRIATDGGQPEKITDSTVTNMWMGSIAWTSDSSLLYGSPGVSGLLRINTGGPATVVTRLRKDRDEAVHVDPVMLPGGTRFLYLAYVTGGARNRIYAAALVDSRPQLVTEADSVVGYTKPYLLFVRDGAIYAQRFDPARSALSGEPRRVIEGVRYREPEAAAFASVSDNGVVEYVPYRPSAARFEVYDRSGSVIRTLWLEPDLWEDVEVSDARLYTTGSMLLVNENQPSKGAADVVSIDLARGIATRLTGGTSTNRNGIWSPDGHSIAFSSDRTGSYDVYVKAADPDAQERAVWKSGFDKHVDDWSPDGNYLLVSVDQPRTRRDVWVLPLNGNEKPWSLAQSEGAESQAQFSPDGSWVAYASTETGPSEVFIRPFRGGRSIRVSTAGGRVPTWSADGKELLFSTPSGQVMLAAIRVNGPMIEAGVPKTLFSNPRMWQPARLMFDGNILIGERANEAADLLNVTTAWRDRAP